MTLANYVKASGAALDYVVDWSGFLDGDTIDTSTWSTSPTGLTTGTTSKTTTTTTIWLSAGTEGVTYTVTNTITTTGGRTDQRSFTLHVGPRAGMVNLVRQLRSYTNTSESDRKLGGNTYWTDEQLQQRLDQTRRTWRFERIDSLPITVNGAPEYYEYQIPPYMGKHFEQGNNPDSGWCLRDSAGGSVDTSRYSFNADARIVSFGTVNQQGSAFYLDVRSYDLNRTAAGIWREKAAYYSTQVDWSSDNHDVKASQRWQHAVQMTEYFEAQAGAYVGRFVRMDEVGT